MVCFHFDSFVSFSFLLTSFILCRAGLLIALSVISVSFLVCISRTDWQKESLLAQERSEKGVVVVEGGDEEETGTSEMIEMLEETQSDKHVEEER